MFVNIRTTPAVIATIAGLAVAVATAGTALAISGGGYTEHTQGCNRKAAANDREHRKQPPGCHDTQIVLRDHHGHTYLETGTRITREGNNVHRLDLAVSPDGSASPKGRVRGTGVALHLDTNYQPLPDDQCGLFDLFTYPVALLTGGACTLEPTKWRLPTTLPTVTHKLAVGKHLLVAPDASGMALYFGANDGLDSGEHDEPDGKHGTSKEQNGPSDGGAVELRAHPTAVASWVPLVVAGVKKGDPAALATNPIPFFDVGAGACADGICIAGETHRRTAWRGGSKHRHHRDAYDYTGKQWDPYDCSGASPSAEKKCHDARHKNADDYYRHEAKHVDVEPGIQLYEDPDPNGSPLLPIYPLPAVYAGSCGVTVGGGAVKLPATPLTNAAGQLSVKPSRC